MCSHVYIHIDTPYVLHIQHKSHNYSHTIYSMYISYTLSMPVTTSRSFLLKSGNVLNSLLTNMCWTEARSSTLTTHSAAVDTAVVVEVVVADVVFACGVSEDRYVMKSSRNWVHMAICCGWSCCRWLSSQAWVRTYEHFLHRNVSCVSDLTYIITTIQQQQYKRQ